MRYSQFIYMIPQSVVKTILFDLDGTLIDNFMAIYRCYVHASTALGTPPLDYDSFKATVGGSLKITLGQLLGESNVDTALALFRQHYQHVMMEDTCVLPGVEWLLTELQKTPYFLSVFTNKSGDCARKICQELELDKLLHDIIGVGDVPEYKPHPEFTRGALERLKADPETTILIGDSIYDIDAAHNFDIRCYIMTTGTHSVEDIAHHPRKPTAVFKNCYELGRHLFNFTPPVSS